MWNKNFVFTFGGLENLVCFFTFGRICFDFSLLFSEVRLIFCHGERFYSEDKTTFLTERWHH